MFYEDNGINAEESKEFMRKVLEDMEHYYYSVEGVLELAEFMSRFSNYSARNMQVIKSQFPDAYACANLNTFKKAGFTSKDGEKKMKIFHPRIKEYVKDPKLKTEVPVKDLTVEQKEKIKKGELKVKKEVTYYLKSSVLDITQTNASSDNLKKIFPNRQFDFKVSEENKNMLMSSISTVAEKEKIEISVNKNNVNSLEIKHVPKVIGELVSEKLLGKNRKEKEGDLAIEFETQMATYIVCNHYGMDTSENVVPYINKWLQSDLNLKDKDSSIVNIHETARVFINSIDQEISGLQEEVEIEMQAQNIEQVENMELKVNDNKQKKFNLPVYQQEILKRIHEKTEKRVSENIGLNFASHWSHVSQQAEMNTKNRWDNYKISLSEDGKIIEDIQPNMILSLGELNTIVNKFGTEEEVGNLKAITKEMKSHNETDLEEKDLLNTHIAKVLVDQSKNMTVECISENVKENHDKFDFNHSVAEAIDSINHSIVEAHKEVMIESTVISAKQQEKVDHSSSKETEINEEITKNDKQEARKMARRAYMQQMER